MVATSALVQCLIRFLPLSNRPLRQSTSAPDVSCKLVTLTAWISIVNPRRIGRGHVQLGSRVSSHATVSHLPQTGFEAVLYLGLALQAVSHRMRDPASSAKRSALCCRVPALGPP